MSLRPDEWTRLKAVFDGARALPEDARSPYLAAACVGDERLRLDVERLLASHDAAGSFLDKPPAVLADQTTLTTRLEGQRIGSYQIEARIGAGGMCEVYRAVDTRLNRPVAVPNMFPFGYSGRLTITPSWLHPTFLPVSDERTCGHGNFALCGAERSTSRCH